MECGLADLELAPDYQPGSQLEPPPGLLALWLAAWAEAAEPLLFVARSERRADALANAVASLAPTVEVVRFPAWDCLPYDRAQPSRAMMGRRMAAVQRLAQPRTRRIVVATPAALAQRVPPADAVVEACWPLRRGEAARRDDLLGFLKRTGYAIDERVDEPGEAALRGGVIDVFPPSADRPLRIELEYERIAALRSYDPLSQRTVDEIDAVTLGPASELPGTDEAEPDAHTLAEHYRALATLFDQLPGARAVVDHDAEARFAGWAEQIDEAYAARRDLRQSEAAMGSARRLIDPARLYLGREEWREALAAYPLLQLEPSPPSEPADRARASLLTPARQRLAAGETVVIALAGQGGQRQRLAGRLGIEAKSLASWREIGDLTPGTLALLDASLPGSFSLPGLTVLGGMNFAGSSGSAKAPGASALVGNDFLRPHDRVVHADHGIAELVGLEMVETAAGIADHAVLRFGDARSLLVPADELDRVWRYGSSEADTGLDRLDGEAWRAKRDEVAAEVALTARALAQRVKERAQLAGPTLNAPRGLDRVAARFPFELSEDQRAAIDATLADLARGAPPMDRLLCGDVGFGKTEVAIRAAAVAAQNGRQVAILAPTTLLVRQHLESLRRRFAGLSVRVEQLSRLDNAKTTREVKSGLADGSVRIVVGTHALAAPGIRFADLALVVIDEEQRFGIAQKLALARLRSGVHVLSMTATPIPRTLQSALAGLQELSVLATPPQRRLPVHTFVLPFEPAVTREALLRERRRGGRSFVVVPRIADLEPMRARLAGIVRELDVTLAHGRMRTADLDRVMLEFAGGAHDVLLTTAIVEAGLDIPGADTMIVWRPDRFGLAQLHQLRGRVGRGRARGACYLLHEGNSAPTPSARRRLETLATFESLGAGFAISARDLDRRGAGSLLGEEQAGHVQRIGIGLYQHLLARALRREHGEPVAEEWSPALALGVPASIPADYVPEPELRLELHGRLSRTETDEALAELAEEIEDRFGEPPAPLRHLLALARLRLRCRDLGVARLDVGPKAAAATLRVDLCDAGTPDGLRSSDQRLILDGDLACEEERLAAAAELLTLIEAGLQPKKPRKAAITSSGRSSGR